MDIADRLTAIMYLANKKKKTTEKNKMLTIEKRTLMTCAVFAT